jgi:Cysteine-rich CPXCG
VFEAGSADAANPTEFVAVQCPYCGESFATTVDLSAGSFSYVEDCQVCCQPIELTSEMNDGGAFVGVIARRAD